MYLYTFNNLLNTSGHSSCVWKSTHICWWPQNEVYNFHVHTCMTQMLYKVTHCAVYISANTRPHQLHWGDWEMGTATMLEIPRYYYMYMYIQYLQPCATCDLGLTFSVLPTFNNLQQKCVKVYTYLLMTSKLSIQFFMYIHHYMHDARHWSHSPEERGH